MRDRQGFVTPPPAQMGETAYERGFAVGLLALPPTANPHEYGTIPWVYWRRGHAAGLVSGGHREAIRRPRR